MNALEFSTLLREWRHQCGYTDPQCAAALDISTGTFCRWKNYFLPDELIVASVAHPIRHGQDLAPVCTGTELAVKLKDYRAHHGLNQYEAAHALGVPPNAVRGIERARNPVDALHVIRAREILRRMQREPDVAAARRACAPVPPMPPQAFAARLRKWRKSHRLRQKHAAAAVRTLGVQIGDGTWPKWERGDQTPWPAIMRAVLAALDRPFTHRRPRTPAPRPLITPRRFAKSLRAWRRAHCLTQLQACAALGLPCDQAIISNWESGKAFPRAERLKQIVAALQQPPASGLGTHNWFSARSNEFGQKLRAWRKARGLRQTDACAALGLPRDQGLICRYERGEASPRRERMTRMLAIIAGAEVQP